MANVTMYGLDNCDTCKKARNWLARANVEHTFADYRAAPIPAPTLKAWAQQLGGWEKLVNRTSTTWRNLPLSRRAPGSDPEWTLLIKEYPALVRRPVVMRDDGVELRPRAAEVATQGRGDRALGAEAEARGLDHAQGHAVGNDSCAQVLAQDRAAVLGHGVELARAAQADQQQLDLFRAGLRAGLRARSRLILLRHQLRSISPAAWSSSWVMRRVVSIESGPRARRMLSARRKLCTARRISGAGPSP